MTPTEPVPQPSLQRLAVVIPVWQPEAVLCTLVAELAAYGFGATIVVDDGSGPRYAALFEEISAVPRTHLLRHARNRGKGCTLKTGFRYFLNELPSMDGLITADADGQHTPADIIRVALAMQASRGRAVLGSRSLSAAVAGVPSRSRFGNALTRRIFGWLTGTRLADTQTGLRALPRSLLPQLAALPGQRYEYEMTMLAHLCRRGEPPLEVPIETVYLAGNRSSRFRPALDSARVCLVLVRLLVSRLRDSRDVHDI